MDPSKLSRGQMIAGGGAIVLIVSLFLAWDDTFTSQSAFDIFSGMDIIMLVIGIAVLAYAAVTAADAQVNLPRNSAWIVVGLGILLIGWSLGWDLEDDSAGIGGWLGLLASIAIGYGGYEAARGPLAIGAPRAAAAPTPTRDLTGERPQQAPPASDVAGSRGTDDTTQSTMPPGS